MSRTCIGCNASLEKDQHICSSCATHLMLGVWTPEDGTPLEDRIWEGLKVAGRKNRDCTHPCPRYFVRAFVPPENVYSMILQECALEWFKAEYPREVWWQLDIQNAPPEGGASA